MMIIDASDGDDDDEEEEGDGMEGDAAEKVEYGKLSHFSLSK